LAVINNRIMVTVAEMPPDHRSVIIYELDFQLNVLQAGLGDHVMETFRERFPADQATALILSEPERLKREVTVIRRQQ